MAVGTEPGALTTFTRFTTREGTHARRPTVVPATPAPVEELTPEFAAAVDVEEHLIRSLTDGGFVALRGPTDRLGDIRRNLAHFGGAPHHVQRVDLEARFLHPLRDAATSRTGTLATLWLVVLSPSVVTKPTVDGHSVPVIGSAEWVDLSDAWLRNDHRSRGRSA